MKLFRRRHSGSTSTTPAHGVAPSDRLAILAEQNIALADELRQLVKNLKAEAKK